jgi:uncharacterized integral membrane protein
MKKVKITIIAIVTLLALIVFLQNTETVETKFLFTKISMPRVLLLIMTFMTGFVVGLLTASHVLRKSSKPVKSSKNV